MTTANGIANIKFENPGKYRIVVKGVLGQEWSERLAGMQITLTHSQKGLPTTTMIGNLRDQAQLSGVLNTLYELHLPIILVEYLKGDNGVDEERLNNKKSR
jgi:hypothetical protein